MSLALLTVGRWPDVLSTSQQLVLTTEFDLRAQANGRFATLRYANNSNYRNDTLIKKETMVSPSVIKEFKKIIADSEILKEDDERWPEKNRDGKQELEVRVGKYHISFETAKIGSLNDVQNSDDPEGLRVFYYLVQDLRAFVFSLISLHFKVSLLFFIVYAAFH